MLDCEPLRDTLIEILVQKARYLRRHLLGVCGHAGSRASHCVVWQIGRVEPIHEKLETIFQHEAEADAPRCGSEVCQ